MFLQPLSLQNRLLYSYPYPRLLEMIEKYSQFEVLINDDEFWREKAKLDLGISDWYWDLPFREGNPASRYLSLLSQKSVEVGSEEFIDPNLCLRRSSKLGNGKLFSYFEEILFSEGLDVDYEHAFYSALEGGQIEFAMSIRSKSNPTFSESIIASSKSGDEGTFLFVWNDFSIKNLDNESSDRAKIEALKNSYSFFLFVSRYLNGTKFSYFNATSEDVEQIAKASSVDGVSSISEWILESGEEISVYRAAFVTSDLNLLQFARENFPISDEDEQFARFTAMAELDDVVRFQSVVPIVYSTDILDVSGQLSIRFSSFSVLEFIVNNSDPVLPLTLEESYRIGDFSLVQRLLPSDNQESFLAYSKGLENAASSANFAIIEFLTESVQNPSAVEYLRDSLSSEGFYQAAEIPDQRLSETEANYL
nr:hypothetical protein pmam_334 [Pithovirus mammoth]